MGDLQEENLTTELNSVQIYMPYKFFTIPIYGDEAMEEALNAFVKSHKVLGVDKQWVDQGEKSFWSFCIDYHESNPSSGNTNRSSGKAKIDYREVLSPEDFAVFAQLRDLRKEIAQGEGVPVYAIFTNEHITGRFPSRCPLMSPRWGSGGPLSWGPGRRIAARSLPWADVALPLWGARCGSASADGCHGPKGRHKSAHGAAMGLQATPQESPERAG